MKLTSRRSEEQGVAVGTVTSAAGDRVAPPIPGTLLPSGAPRLTARPKGMNRQAAVA